MKHRSLYLSSLFLLALLFATAAGPSVSRYSFDQQDPSSLLQPPSAAHWMGTDRLGRDLFTRVLAGGRLSISIGLFSAVTALIIGVLYGGAAGYGSDRTDQILMRGLDIVFALPDILLIILMMVVLGRGLLGIFLALTLVSWVTVARLVRGEVLRLKEHDFVFAAAALGAGNSAIFFRHILPNILGPLIVTLSYRIPAAILAESTLSFIGLGLAPPAASWGILANEGWSGMRFYPYLIFFPSIFIFLTILSLNTLGDRLRDMFDPREGPEC